MAASWADSLNINQTESRTTYIRELEPVAADFLDLFAQELQKEPNLSELNDSRALESLVRDNAAIRLKLSAEQFTPGTLKDYLYWLIQNNLYLDPKGSFQTQRQIQVKLDEIYISLRAQRDEAAGDVDRRLLDQELAALNTQNASTNMASEEAEDQYEQLLARFENKYSIVSSNTPSEVLELAEVVKRHDHLVILGDPGSGKTTLLRYLALKNAQALKEGKPLVGIEPGIARFPILIRISEYAQDGTWKRKSLSDFLIDYYGMHECPKAGLADLLATQLAEGKCLILLDGLDEIVSADDRRAVVEQIEYFVHHYDNSSNSFVISSRVAGYRTSPLSGSFAHYIVQEMDKVQIRRFLERWCPAVETAQTPDLSIETREAKAHLEIEGIMEAVQSSPGVSRLAANPLLLRILALIHHAGAQLPQRRIELYKLAAETLARTWRIAHGIPESALVKEEYLTRLLGYLAYWLHRDKPTGIATEREVYEVLGREWARIKSLPWDEDDPDPNSVDEVNKFLIAVREHTGLFVERAPKRYGFMHLTFEEYYAARYLVARSKNRAHMIRKHLHDARWEEPILLALGFIGLDSPDEVTELVETAIMAQGEEARDLSFTPSLYEDILGRDYLFAVRCLGDQIPVNSILVQQIINRLMNQLIHRIGSARFSGYYNELLQRASYLKANEIKSLVHLSLQTALQDADADVRKRATGIFGKLGQASDEVVSALLQALQDADAGVRKQAAESLGRLEQITSDVMNILLNSLNEDDNELRIISARLLSNIMQDDVAVIPPLLHGLLDRDFRIRNACAESLKKLAQHSSSIAKVIAQKTEKMIRNLEFEKYDSQFDSSASDVAYELLLLTISLMNKAELAKL